MELTKPGAEQQKNNTNVSGFRKKKKTTAGEKNIMVENTGNLLKPAHLHKPGE